LVPDNFVLAADDDMETQPGDNFALYGAIILLLISGAAIFGSKKLKTVKQKQ